MVVKVNKLIEYFDLGSRVRPPQNQEGVNQGGQGSGVVVHWFPQYLALLCGIALQPHLQKYMATGRWDLDHFWGWVVASGVIAIMAFPGVYRNSFDPKQPVFVQLCVIFTAGTGWQSLVSTALKTAGVSTGTGTPS